MLRVKICGITQAEDALLACELGADAIGLIFYSKSPRSITLEQAAEIARQLPAHVARVGVFVNTPCDEITAHVNSVQLDAVQFHGDYRMADIEQFGSNRTIGVARVGETFRIEELARFQHRTAAILLDTQKKGVYGGTGETFDWQIARDAKAYGRIILAGGLSPDNVRQAIHIASPYAIDVSSGVEVQPGKKDHQKLRRLFQEIEEYRSGWTPDPIRRFPLA